MAATPHLRLSKVTKRFGSVVASDDISLDISPGECVSLLGPSGCGKTTLLNLIAGFLSLDGGRIEIGGKDIARVPSHKRNLGIVFQNYALFPHLTAEQNVNFGLRMRSVRASEAAQRVQDALNLVRLTKQGSRYPHQLSGGQQQRVAIARALVIQPEILLLDEPLSNLDAKLREEMRTEMLDLLQRLGITTVLVTHDQAEALALSDRVAVLNAGRIEQIAAPRQIYEQPASSFVAKFIGESNRLEATITDTEPEGLLCLTADGMLLHAPGNGRFARGDQVELIIRMEHVCLSGEQGGIAENCFEALLEHVIFLGGEVRYVLRVGGARITAVDKNRDQSPQFETGSKVFVSWSRRNTIVGGPVEQGAGPSERSR